MGGSIGNIRDSEATVGNSDDSNDFGRSNQPEYNYKNMNMIKNGLLVMITNRSNGNSFDEEQAIVGVTKSSTNDLVTLCYTDESGFLVTRSFVKQTVRNVTHIFGEKYHLSYASRISYLKLKVHCLYDIVVVRC